VVIVTSVPGADCQYRIGLGETLSQIAAQYNLETSDIVQANAITNPDLITAGDILTIPGCGQTAATTSPAAGTGGGPTATPVLVNRGQGYQIGGPNDPQAGTGGATSASTVGATDNSQGPFVYTVQAGDRLYQLAITYGITLRALIAANPQVTDMNVIYEGQRITIPGPPTTTTSTSSTGSTGQTAPIIITATPATGAVQPPAFTPTPTVPGAPQG
jgi:LysM repeat protein